ncbi:MAG: FAD-binding protein [Boseongicola sp.]
MLAPVNEAELSEAIADANGPLNVRGGGTRPVGNPVDGAILSVAGISGITLYEPGALTLVAKAGTPVAEIETALETEGQMLPFEPMDHRDLLGTKGEPTIGGVVASNVSGPRRLQVGACRDFLLGVRFVDGRGDVVKSGGRVMKNVTGYDLVKLMAGSRGTLGVLTEVSLKVLPKPEATSTLMVHGLSVENAVQAMSAALSSPYDVSGAAHAMTDTDGIAATMIRLEGFADSVAYRSDKIRALLSEHFDASIDIRKGSNAKSLGWESLRDAEAFARFDGDVWRFSVKPGDAPGVEGAIVVATGDPDRCLFQLDWGGGLIWVGCPPGTNLRPHAGKGHATLIRASDESKVRLGVFHPEAPPLAALAMGLRQQFDPRAILNPGLIG